LQYHNQKNLVDTTKILMRCGNILNSDAMRTAAVIQILAINNIDVGKAIRRNPKLLRLSPEVLAARLDSLRALGIDGPRAIKQQPTVLNLLSHTIEKKTLFLFSIGFNAKALIHRSSKVLTFSKDAIRSSIEFLKGNGLDAMRILGTQPTLMGSHTNRRLRPMIEFITKDMGRSHEEINRCPRCLTASLEQRLKPRYRYTVLYGKRKDYSLNTFTAATDKNFVWTVAHQPLDHYRQWCKSTI